MKNADKIPDEVVYAARTIMDYRIENLRRRRCEGCATLYPWVRDFLNSYAGLFNILSPEEMQRYLSEQIEITTNHSCH